MKKEHKKTKKAGIWLDGTVAHLIKVKKAKMVVENIFAAVVAPVAAKGKKTAAKAKGNTHTEAFFKAVTSAVKKYDTIYLFGPADAKKQLMEHIRANKSISGKTCIVDSAEELSFNQMVAKVNATLGEV